MIVTRTLEEIINAGIAALEEAIKNDETIDENDENSFIAISIPNTFKFTHQLLDMDAEDSISLTHEVLEYTDDGTVIGQNYSYRIDTTDLYRVHSYMMDKKYRIDVVDGINTIEVKHCHREPLNEEEGANITPTYNVHCILFLPLSKIELDVYEFMNLYQYQRYAQGISDEVSWYKTDI